MLVDGNTNSHDSERTVASGRDIIINISYREERKSLYNIHTMLGEKKRERERDKEREREREKERKREGERKGGGEGGGREGEKERQGEGEGVCMLSILT